MIATFIVFAGLMGAAGVALAAAAAHAAPGQGLDAAAWLLLIHAAALLGIAANTPQNLGATSAALVGAGFIAGCVLFSGDVALKVLAGHRLFPMAAPTGGTILILSWLALAVFALFALRGR
jgi:uncharacterized membrane protein YgdD (TMEM256/DUF423 family)